VEASFICKYHGADYSRKNSAWYAEAGLAINEVIRGINIFYN
jgi:hypothetical protein